MTYVQAPPDLSGLRLLVVEDTFLVADLIVEQLHECGCTVVGPVARLPAALALAEAEPLDGALLDINLAGERSFPVATILAGRGVPFVFLTGYGELAMPDEFVSSPRLTKPFGMNDLIREAAAAFLPRLAAITAR